MAAAVTDSLAIKGLLGDIQNGIKFSFQPALAKLVNWGGNEEIPVNRWFRYREAYSPNLIAELDLGRNILDPFCGCGSIMVGAAMSNHYSAGVDINPIAVFAARVKLTPLTNRQLKKAGAFLDNYQSLLSHRLPWPVPALSIADKVFEPVILETVGRLRSALEEYASGDEALRNFLLLAWLSILERVGSYFKEGNGIKYRNKKRLRSGYVRREDGEWQRKRFGEDQRAFVCDKFSNQLSLMLSDAPRWAQGLWSEQRVHEGSALELGEIVPEREFDSIVFSPPYANRFDYFESLKVELWFGGFVNSYGELNTLRKRSLRSHLGADLSRPAIDIDHLEKLISFMDPDSSSWRMRVPTALRGYFDDMFQVLVQCRRKAPNGACYIVVGNSAFAGVIIPTDSLLAELGLRAGFASAEVITVRHLTVAPQQRSMLCGLEEYMRESIVILK